MEHSNQNKKNWPSDSELKRRQVETAHETANDGRNEGFDAIGDEREKLMFAGKNYRNNQHDTDESRTESKHDDQ